MDLIQAAVILLCLRIVSVAVILYIIFKITLPNLRAANDPQVAPVRWVLFGISLALLAGNAIPVIVDAASIFAGLERSTRTLSTAGVIYAFNNAISHVIYSFAFLFLFVKSGQINVQLKAANKQLQEDNDELHRKMDS